MISLYSGRIEERDIVKRLFTWLHRGNVKLSEFYRRFISRAELHDLRHVQPGETALVQVKRPTSLESLAVEIMHEVRNPLGSITLYASLIQAQPAGETARWANEILRASQRLQTTIAQLLSFATETRLTAEWLSVMILLQEVRDVTFPLWHSGKWQLETDVHAELPPLWGDRVLLTQALTNLLHNATEAMPDGGTVTIRAYRSMPSSTSAEEQHTIAIQIEDEGSGIAQCDREKIFTPFFTTKRSGTGIGLALTQKIIHAHHGTIELSDAPEHGSCFTVFLPAGDTMSPVYALPSSALPLAHHEARESV